MNDMTKALVAIVVVFGMALGGCVYLVMNGHPWIGLCVLTIGSCIDTIPRNPKKDK